MATTKAYKWRTSSTSYVYVDSSTGSDIYGDGTQANPYQSLGKAWRGHTTYHPATIVCRGSFSEDMSDGTHSSTIQGDYWGAATFDGNDNFTCYGFVTPNMMFVNCPAVTFGNSATTGNSLPVGVGRALYAGNVGNASNVYGVAASSVCLRACGLYMGAIGGNTAAQYVSVASPKANSTYLLWFAAYGSSTTVKAFNVFDVPKSLRSKQKNTSSKGNILLSWVFGKTAIFVDEYLTFNGCFFASDCEFYDGDTLLTLEGTTSAERAAWLTSYIAAKGLADAAKSVFTDCVFSDKTSYDVFNDPDNGDLSLRYDKADEELLPYQNNYRGAMPPAIRVPVMANSEGVPATWDELTASGVVEVSGNKIVLSDDALGLTTGQISSKVLVLDPDRIAVSGLFAQYSSKFQTYGLRAGDKWPEGDKYPLGSTLPEGRYIARDGSLLCDGVYIAEGATIVVGSAGATISQSTEDEEGVAYASQLLDSNINDYLMLRTAPTAYALIKASDGLQAGGVYLNLYDKPITYRGRTVAHNESFTAVNSTDTFSCAGDADYRIGVIFDDTRVPSQPWIPAEMWGEYFAGRIGNAYQTDSEGNYLGSGNYLTWFTAANGGYSSSLVKSRAQARYVQLKLIVKSLSKADA